MYRTQELEIKNSIDLSDVQLDKNREIEILADISKDISETKYIKLVNVNGKIIIFIEDIEDVIIKEWKGHLPHKKVIRDIEDEIDDNQ